MLAKDHRRLRGRRRIIRLLGYLLPACLLLSLLTGAQAESPETAAVRMEMVHSRDRYPAGDAYPVLFRIHIAETWYIHGTRESQAGLIPTVLNLSDHPHLVLEEIRFPPPELKSFPYAEGDLEVYAGRIPVQATLRVKSAAPPGVANATAKLLYQACSLELCRPPETADLDIAIPVAPVGAEVRSLNPEVFAGSAPEDPRTGADPWTMGSGLWLTLLGIFLGGLALNLTPCVYPLVPITVSYFGGRSDRMAGRSVLHGALYILGIGTTNSALGVTASLSGGLLGGALQNPLVLIGVASIMVVLALSFFGCWELRVPAGLTQIASKNFGGYFGTFFMGLTLGIVAAPCLGPFILGLLTYVGQKGDPYIGFLYFFVLSLGLGLPLAVLAVFSGTVQKLPYSGTWMVWVRKLLGWVLVGMAGYLLQPLITDPMAQAALFAAILIGAGIHLGWLDDSGGGTGVFPHVKRIVGIGLIAAALLPVVMELKVREGIDWAPYDPQIVAGAAQENRPVMLDFYADWCSPCKAMDRQVFTDPEIVAMSRRLVPVRVDLTQPHPRQEEILEQYRIRGVPTVVFINSRGEEERELRVESYSERGEILNRMRSLLNGS